MNVGCRLAPLIEFMSVFNGSCKKGAHQVSVAFLDAFYYLGDTGVPTTTTKTFINSSLPPVPVVVHSSAVSHSNVCVEKTNQHPSMITAPSLIRKRELKKTTATTTSSSPHKSRI